MMIKFLIFFTVFLYLEYATLPVLAETHVALVSTSGEKAENNVLPLAEVLLSKQPDITLVERREVERILNEQKLILSGLCDSDKAMAIGKLMGVEIFAVLEILPGSKETLGLIVFDAGNGVKLLDMTLPADEIEKTAKIVVTGVSKACAKRQQPALQRKTVCLLSVRNAELPREMDGFCACLGMLLERALLDSPGIVVLERNRLELVNRERSLPVAEELKDLWSSVVVVESDVRRAADGRDLRVVCHLSNVTGQDIGTVEATASQTNADSLARELAGRLTESLHVVSISAAEAKPIVEANRFYGEAQFLLGHGDRSAAIPHMYAACALAPTNEAFRAKLKSLIADDICSHLAEAKRLFMWADHRTIRQYPVKVTKANRRYKESGLRCLAEGREQLTKAMDEMGPVLVEQHADDDRWFRDNTNSFKMVIPLNGADRFIVPLRRLYDRGDESQQSRIQTIINEYMDHIANRIEIVLFQIGGAGNDNKLLIDQNTDISLTWLRYIHDLSVNPNDDYYRLFAKIAIAWLKISEHVYHGESSAQKKWDPRSAYVLLGLFLQECTGINSIFWPEFAGNSSIMNEVSIKIGDAMAGNPYSFIRLYGHAIELNNVLQSNCLPPDIAQQQRIEFKEMMLNILLTKPTAIRYNDANFLFQKLFHDTNELYEAQVELCDTMLNNHIIDEGALESLINNEPDLANKIKWIERVLAVNELIFHEDHHHSFGVREKFNQLLNEILPPGTYNEAREKEFSRLREYNRRISSPPPVVSPTPPPLVSVLSFSNLPWTEIHKVFDITSIAGLKFFDLPVMDDEAIFVLGHGLDMEHGDYIKLLKIYLPDGVIQQFGDIQYYGSGQDACLGNGHFYAAMDLPRGIYDFPLGPGEVRCIDRNNGLPSSVVYSIAYLDGRLYAGLGGDGYIISYDLASNRTLVLASSRRREKLSPLDNGPPFQTDHMLADPPRSRVLFHIPGQQKIWQINQNDTIRLYTQIINNQYARIITNQHAKIARVIEVQPSEPQNKWKRDRPFLKNEQWDSFLYTYNNAVVYNLLDGQCEIITTPCQGLIRIIESSTERVLKPPPCQVVGKWLWTANPFARICLENLTTEQFPGLVREGVGLGFNPTECIFPFNNGKQLLLGDGRTLWLVDLKID